MHARLSLVTSSEISNCGNPVVQRRSPWCRDNGGETGDGTVDGVGSCGDFRQGANPSVKSREKMFRFFRS